MSTLDLIAIEKLLGVQLIVAPYEGSSGVEWIAEFKKDNEELSFTMNNYPACQSHHNNPALAVIELCKAAQGQTCSYGGSMNNPHGEIVTFPDIIDHGIKI